MFFNRNKVYTCSKHNYSGINQHCPDCEYQPARKEGDERQPAPEGEMMLLLPIPYETRIVDRPDELCGTISSTECCQVGPITTEKYCSDCGRKIVR